MSAPDLPRDLPPRNRHGARRLRCAIACAALSAAIALFAKAAPGADPVVKLGGSVEDTPAGGIVVRAILKIAAGYHINAHEPDDPYLIPTVLTLTADGADLSEPEYPPPESQEFGFAPGKKLLVYDGEIAIVARADGRPESAVHAKVRYQACTEEKCLPPATVEAFLTGPRPAEAAVLPPAGGGETSWLSRWLTGASLPAAIGMTLLLGLTLNLTPCVYPLISVTIGFFGRQTDTQARRPWPLAIAYVIGITLSFAILGVTASLAGGLFGAPLQHPVVLVLMAILMLTLAASSFGSFEIRAPSALLARFGGSATGVGGALLMGLTMGVVAAPCIGPVVLGLLVYVASERDVWKGLALFLAMGFGMGFPYVFLATAAGSLVRLPRAGEWLRWMNRLFGVLLLGMAIYFVSPLLSESVTRILVPLFIGAAGLYLGFLEPSGQRLRAFTFGRRAAGACAIAFAAWIGLLPAQAGSGIRWEPLSASSLDRAIAAQRPAVVEFSAEWCLPCVEMEHSTFTDPGVLQEAERFSMLQADVTESSPANDMLLEQFGVLGVPTIIFYDETGREVDRAVGFVSAMDFRAMLARIGSRVPGRAPRDDGDGGEDDLPGDGSGSPQMAHPDSGNRVGT